MFGDIDKVKERVLEEFKMSKSSMKTKSRCNHHLMLEIAGLEAELQR